MIFFAPFQFNVIALWICVRACVRVRTRVSFFLSFFFFVHEKKVKKVLTVNFCRYLPIKIQAFLIKENDYLK